MKRLQVLKAALVGGASILTLVQPSAAKVFDIPDGDLSAVLGVYVKQSNAELLYSDDDVRGHKSRGAKGDYTAIAALTQILRGTGFAAQTLPSNAIEIVPQQKQPVEIAQAAPRHAPTAPAARAE